MASSPPPVSNLPVDLFQSRDLFSCVLRDGWHLIPGHKKQQLMDKFLPSSLDASSREESVQMLLSDQLTNFDSNPMDCTFFHLKLSRLAPDICKSLEDIRRLKQQAFRLKEKENQMIMWTEVLSCRKQLLRDSITCSPADPLCVRTRLKSSSTTGIRTQRFDISQRLKSPTLLSEIVRKRVVRRYKQELKELNCMTVIMSDDEEDEDPDLSCHSDDSRSLPSDCYSFRDGIDCKVKNKSHDSRYRKLLSDYRKKNKNARRTGSITKIVTNCAVEPAEHLEEQLRNIADRVNGSTEDMITLISPPISPLGPKRKIKSLGTDGQKSAARHQTLKVSIKKEVLPLLPGIELMSRKLDLNLNSLKKEHKTSADVFDFHDDSPSESLVPESESTPLTASQFTATAACETDAVVAMHMQKPLIANHSVKNAASALLLPHVTSSPPVATTQAKVLYQQPSITVCNQILSQVHSSAHMCLQQNSASVSSPLVLQQPAVNTQVTPLPQTLQSGRISLMSAMQTPPLRDMSAQPVVQNHVKTKTPPPVVYDDPPASFFSLIREVFKSSSSQSDLKLTLHKLEELVKDKLRAINPALGWNHESVQSAMNFLSYFTDPLDADAIPVVDYKEKNQQWQWIGQERDSDEVLASMCKEWQSEKDRYNSVMDSTQAIPPPSHPTEWTVKPSTDGERTEYRQQEAIRYNNPNKAFTYRIHAYESVVGPVKGCSAGVTVGTAPTQSPNKAREHSLLVSDRPPFVTLLSLVRDAAARLPNGEGTRADICELLKDSQYLLSTVSDQQINSIVSGALDRLHYEKDPCVKYDVNRKVWIYLHRNRSQTDFERLHDMQIAAAKAKKNLCKTQKKPLRQTVTSPTLPTLKSNQHKRPSDCSIVSPITSSGQTRINISPLVPVGTLTQDSTDKTILNILNQVQGSNQLVAAKKKVVKEVQIVHNVPASTTDPTITSTVASIVRPVTANNSSLIPVSTVTTTNRLIASADTRDKVQRPNTQNASLGPQTLHKIPVKPAMTVLPSKTRPQHPQCVPGHEIRSSCSPAQQILQSKVPVPNRMASLVTSQSVPSQQTISIASGQGTQITVPTSMLIGSRNAQFFLGGKSFMMTPQNGGSLVLHTHTPVTMATSQTSVGTNGPQQVRVQGIKVISVPSNSPRLLVPPQGQQQVVARLLSRSGPPPIQPVILTHSPVPGLSSQAQVVQHVTQHPQLLPIQPQVQPVICKQPAAQPSPQ